MTDETPVRAPDTMADKNDTEWHAFVDETNGKQFFFSPQKNKASWNPFAKSPNSPATTSSTTSITEQEDDDDSMERTADNSSEAEMSPLKDGSWLISGDYVTLTESPASEGNRKAAAGWSSRSLASLSPILCILAAVAIYGAVVYFEPTSSLGAVTVAPAFRSKSLFSSPTSPAPTAIQEVVGQQQRGKLLKKQMSVQWDKLSHSTKDRTTQIGNQLGRLSNSTKDRTSQFGIQLGKLSEAAVDRTSQFGNQLGKLSSSAQNQTSQLGNQLANSVKDRASELGNQLEKISDAAKNQTAHWGNQLEQLSNTAKDRTFDFGIQLREKMGEHVQKSQEAFHLVYDDSRVERWVGETVEFFPEAYELVKYVREKSKQPAEEVLEEAKERVIDVWKKAHELDMDVFDDISVL